MKLKTLFTLAIILLTMSCSSDDSDTLQQASDTLQQASDTLQQASATQSVLKVKTGRTFPRISDDTNDIETYNVSAASQIEIENHNSGYTYKLQFKGQQFGRTYLASEEKEEEQNSRDFEAKVNVNRLTVDNESDNTSNATVVEFEVDDLKMEVDFYEVSLLEVESNNTISVGNFAGNTQEYRLLDTSQSELATTIGIQVPGNISYLTEISEISNFNLNFVGQNDVRLFTDSNETPHLAFLNVTSKALIKRVEVQNATTFFDNNTSRRYYSFDRMDSPSTLGISPGKYSIRLEMLDADNQIVSKSPLIPLEITASLVQFE
ncbi:hypothetical protein ACXGQW_02650 [Wenyingzhuangia sp. IMCC45533]